jgi:hypothetical protein
MTKDIDHDVFDKGKFTEEFLNVMASGMENLVAKEERANVFFKKMEDTYRLDSNEKWIIDINFTYEEREQAIRAYISILKELGIEKTCTIIEQLLDEENLTLLALGQAIIRNR